MTDPQPSPGERPTQSIVGSGPIDPSGPAFEARADEDSAPDRVPGYRLLQRLGRGGMGTVYAAVREGDDAQRRVAVKVLRRGVDTEDVLERFELEKQLLGALAHPNIARFYDAGRTEDGRPYLILEYIEGQPIDVFCDANNLSVAARLELFRKVCSAVQHAHENLIVHRDLKPSNIMVTTAGEPKLLDFGIAKLLNPGLARLPIVTGPAVRLMTPEYASPEQVTGAPITTRSDVYSLGVLLYELLCGHRPYRLETRLEEEIKRVICETDPDRPSTALTRIEEMSLADGRLLRITPEDVARRRAAQPTTLRRQLSGDLDDIVMRALEKTPDRRQDSAEALAAEIGMHLEGRPVPSRSTGRRWLYVSRKYVRRHKAGVLAATVALVAIVAGSSVAAWQWKAAVDARLAEADADRRALITASFGDALWKQLSSELEGVPLPVGAREDIWSSVLESYGELRDRFGDDDPDVLLEYARALKELGDVQGSPRGPNSGDTANALLSYQAARDIYLALLDERPDDLERTLEAAVCLLHLGDIYRSQNQTTRAVEAYGAAYGLAERLADEDTFRRELSAPSSPSDRWRCARATSRRRSSCIARRWTSASRSSSDGPRRSPRGATSRFCSATWGTRTSATTISSGRRASTGASHEIRGALLTQRPDHPSLIRDRAVTHIRLGGILSRTARHTAAAEEFAEGHELLSRLIEMQPDDARARSTMLTLVMASASAHIAANEPDNALRDVAEAQSIAGWLRANAAGNADLPEHDVAIELTAGRARARAGDPGGAKEHVERAMGVLRELRAADPDRAAPQGQWIEAMITLGDAELALASGAGPSEAAAHREAAVQAFRSAEEMRDTMRRSDTLCGLSAALSDALDTRLREAADGGT